VWQEAADDRLRCDSLGCVYRLRDKVFALTRQPEAFADDCRNADVVATALPVRIDCPSATLFIDGRALKRLGTHALWLDADGAHIETVAGWQGDRPWNHSAGMFLPARPSDENQPLGSKEMSEEDP
jgi:competence protein ComEC